MKGLSTIERMVLEAIELRELTYQEILEQSGLRPHVCRNVLEVLIVKGLLRFLSGKYSLSKNITKNMMDDINGMEAKFAESMELIEAVAHLKTNHLFKLQKIALDEKDEKLFHALLLNLESFLKDAHKKSSKHTPIKKRKVIFWGLGEMNQIMQQLTQETL